MVVWPGTMPVVHLPKMFMLQKCALCTIHNAPYNSHIKPLFKSAGILKLLYLDKYQTTASIPTLIIQFSISIQS